MIFVVSTVYCVIILNVYAAYGQESPPSRTPRMKACTYDTDCIENAYCKEQTYCQCKQNFLVFIDSNKVYSCLKEASAIDDMCVEEIQCTKPFGVDALCDWGRCSCKPNAHFKDGRCYETSSLGGKCKVRNNCKIDSDIEVYCDKSICVCPQRHHSNAMNTDCLPSSYIGEPCESDLHCLTNNALCATVCRCKIGYVVSQDEMRCLKAAIIEGDHCEENAQCNEFLHNMRCLKGTCFCDENYHSILSVCWRSISLGDRCTDSKECVVTSNNQEAATCSQGYCQCSSGYAVDRDDPKNCNTLARGGNARQMPLTSTIIALLLFQLIAK